MKHFDIINGGSIVSIAPLTREAREWVEEKVHIEPWQWLGGSFHVDHRMAQPLIDGINAEFAQ